MTPVMVAICISVCIIIPAAITVLIKRRKIIPSKKQLTLRASAKAANCNYYLIKEKLAKAKPLVRLRFKLLVGTKRFTDYTFQG